MLPMKVPEFLNLVCEALGLPPRSLSLDATPQTVPQWDSIGHLSIIAIADERLGVRTNDADLHNFTSIGQLVERLKARNVLED
jgi:acyl carrier protein